MDNADKVAAIFLELDTKENIKIVDRFQFEMKRLWATIYAMDEQKAVIDIKEKRNKIRSWIYDFLDISKKTPEERKEFQKMLEINYKGDRQEYLRTLIINYLCTYDEPKKWLREHPEQSVGFMVSMNTIQEDLLIAPSEYNAFVKITDTLISKHNKRKR